MARKKRANTMFVLFAVIVVALAIALLSLAQSQTIAGKFVVAQRPGVISSKYQAETKYCDAASSSSDDCSCTQCNTQADAGDSCTCIATQKDQEQVPLTCQDASGNSGQGATAPGTARTNRQISRFPLSGSPHNI